MARLLPILARRHPGPLLPGLNGFLASALAGVSVQGLAILCGAPAADAIGAGLTGGPIALAIAWLP